MKENDVDLSNSEIERRRPGCNGRVLLTLAILVLPFPAYDTYVGESLNKRAGYWLPRDLSKATGNTSFRFILPQVEDVGQEIPKHDLFPLSRSLELSLQQLPRQQAYEIRLYRFAQVSGHSIVPLSFLLCLLAFASVLRTNNWREKAIGLLVLSMGIAMFSLAWHRSYFLSFFD